MPSGKPNKRRKTFKQSKAAAARRRKTTESSRTIEALTSLRPNLVAPPRPPDMPLHEMREARAVEVRDSDAELFDSARSQWLAGDWDSLAGWHVAEFANHPKRVRIALLIAAGLHEVGDDDGSKEALRQAVEWGARRHDLLSTLIGQVHVALGRARLAEKKYDCAEKHFLASITCIAPCQSAARYAKDRLFKEAVNMGYLPDAHQLLKMGLESLGRGPYAHTPEISIFATKVDLLGHELSLAIQRAQVGVHPGNRSSVSPPAYGKQQEAQLADVKKRSSSQLGQELWVLERTAFKRGGFFVDFGATDGIRLSNTYLLETEFGWAGLCAEPNHQFFSRLRHNRSCTVSDQCISGVSGEEVEFLFADEYGGIIKHFHDGHGELRRGFVELGQARKLHTVSLHDFLVQHNAPRTIDYLSIDTEGSEYEILRHFPFKEWNVRLITVEHNFTPIRRQLRELLTHQGYSVLEKQFDDWYELKY